jgi:hypothetical protein
MMMVMNERYQTLSTTTSDKILPTVASWRLPEGQRATEQEEITLL